MTSQPTPQIAIIVALDEHNGIGRNGELLCHLPEDLKHFKQLTTGHSIIMGRKTYESLPKGALPNRTNIVITSDLAENYPECIVVRSVEEALAHCKDEEVVFIIGGGELYRSSLHIADKLYLTRIHHTFDDADTFFPIFDLDKWELTHNEEHKADEMHNYNYSFLTYLKN
ncbi:dihydrofolate reductase [Proteiniphilum sp.]|uniref:dihydrofolate reductase n=1 Tax=Proteiniphilum sp. TaxID=1926877 RepID=UPI002B218714|nr:dihydrofolate reductase [Proteiniphilum sp.]MEA4917432.1 dihydrofolate reductase [Proteiniphilum sp.]